MPPLVADVVTAARPAAGAAPAWAAAGAVRRLRPCGIAFSVIRKRKRFRDPRTGERVVPDSVVGRQRALATGSTGCPRVLDIAGARPRIVAGHRSARSVSTLSTAVGAEIGEVARRHRATPFMVVRAALAVLLSRLSATDDIAIAAPVAGRGQRKSSTRLSACSVNTPVLRTQVDQHDSFTELLRQVRHRSGCLRERRRAV